MWERVNIINWKQSINLGILEIKCNDIVDRKETILLDILEILSSNSRAPVAQSVATQAVNPGVVSLNPSSANILTDV